MRKPIFVIVPNWNGAEDLGGCVESVLEQSFKNFKLVIVDNGSIDHSKKIIESYETKDERVTSVYRDKNYGFTGGVNPGIELAIKENADFVALLNNDAIANKDWLKHLHKFLVSNPDYGIAACALLHSDGKTIDSTADQYTVWGIPFPRGRNEKASDRYSTDTDIFGASGGASMYRVEMLKQIGTFDQDFFAYYEDIDISFRAQLAGWKVSFVPESVVYHQQGKTSAKIANKDPEERGATPFTTQQYMKNLPFIIIKDMPFGLLWRILPRFLFAYNLFFFKAIVNHRACGALKGVGLFWLKLPKKLIQRRHIQQSRKVSNDYLWSIFTHDLPPNAYKLRKIRSLVLGAFGRR